MLEQLNNDEGKFSCVDVLGWVWSATESEASRATARMSFIYLSLMCWKYAGQRRWRRKRKKKTAGLRKHSAGS